MFSFFQRLESCSTRSILVKGHNIFCIRVKYVSVVCRSYVIPSSLSAIHPSIHPLFSPANCGISVWDQVDTHWTVWLFDVDTHTSNSPMILYKYCCCWGFQKLLYRSYIYVEEGIHSRKQLALYTYIIYTWYIIQICTHHEANGSLIIGRMRSVIYKGIIMPVHRTDSCKGPLNIDNAFSWLYWEGVRWTNIEWVCLTTAN